METSYAVNRGLMGGVEWGMYKEDHETQGYGYYLEIEEILHFEKSDIQEILVFKSSYGYALATDGVLQILEKDEYTFNEMEVHLALNSHPNPQKVLLVGVGSGGNVKEILKHSTVEKVVCCEIDKSIINLSRKYFPRSASAFDDPKVELVIGDGADYVKDKESEYDVIITEGTDCIGPGHGLYQPGYVNNLKRALKTDGILLSMCSTLYTETDIRKNMLEINRQLFPTVDYAFTVMQAFGTIGFILSSLNSDKNFRQPVNTLTQAEVDAMELKYYNTDMHRAAFCLPESVKKEVFANE